MPDATQRTAFDDPVIEREYLRWRKKLGGAFPSAKPTLNASEALYAHFLIAQFFADEKCELGGIGPRDDGHLLHSALSRQFVEFGGVRKWSSDLHITATTLFGLIKNHPFHDGNKRTALLSALHLLRKQGWTVNAEQHRLDDFVVKIAESEGRGEDGDIEKIARDLSAMARQISRARHTLTYRQLSPLLRRLGFEFRRPQNNRIDVTRSKDGKKLHVMGFPGMTREVPRGELKQMRVACRLTEADGCDSEVFYGNAEMPPTLAREYAESLKKLANR